MFHCEFLVPDITLEILLQGLILTLSKYIFVQINTKKSIQYSSDATFWPIGFGDLLICRWTFDRNPRGLRKPRDTRTFESYSLISPVWDTYPICEYSKTEIRHLWDIATLPFFCYKGSCLLHLHLFISDHATELRYLGMITLSQLFILWEKGRLHLITRNLHDLRIAYDSVCSKGRLIENYSG